MSRWVRGLFAVLGVLVFVAGLMAFIGHKVKMGTKYAATPKESINYSGTATEADAKGLGEELKEIGYFGGDTGKDVLLHKEATGTVISFVVGADKWNDETVVAGFRSIGEKVASTVGGDSVSVELLDDNLNKQKAFSIDRRVIKASKQERVRYHESIPRSEAESLVEALKTTKYFDASGPSDVFFDKGDKGPILSFVVAEGAWDKPETVKFYRQLSDRVAKEINAKPLTIKLIDAKLKPQKEFTIE